MNNRPREDWQRYKLDELGFVGRGRSRHRPRNHPSLYGGPYPFFQTGDIKAADLYLSRYSQTYNEKGLAQSKLWKSGTLCITIAANIAETAILAVNGCFPDSVVGFVPDPDKADVRFIKYYIDEIKLQMQNVSKGTTQDNLSLDKLLSFDFSIPPINTQRKIAAILSAYDDLIENNTRRIAILEDMAQAIYREWLVHFRFPGHEGVPLVDSELGPVPEGWEVRPVADLCSKVTDGTHDSPKPVERGYYLVTGKHLINGFIDFSSCYFISAQEHEKVMERSKPDRGDIIFSNIGTLGSTVIVDQDFEFSIKNVALFKPLAKIYSKFLYLYLSSPDTQERMLQHASGTSQRFLSLQLLREFKMIRPPDSVLSLFHEVAEPILELRSSLRKRNANLRQTRDLLLPRLVSGELDVSELEIDTEGLDV